MGSYIARQPNGILCRHSTVVDSVTDWNMTEDDYIKMRPETALEVLSDYMQPYQNVINDFRPQNMTSKEFKELRKIMEEKV